MAQKYTNPNTKCKPSSVRRVATATSFSVSFATKLYTKTAMNAKTVISSFSAGTAIKRRKPSRLRWPTTIRITTNFKRYFE